MADQGSKPSVFRALKLHSAAWRNLANGEEKTRDSIILLEGEIYSVGRFVFPFHYKELKPLPCPPLKDWRVQETWGRAQNETDTHTDTFSPTPRGSHPVRWIPRNLCLKVCPWQLVEYKRERRCLWRFLKNMGDWYLSTKLQPCPYLLLLLLLFLPVLQTCADMRVSYTRCQR